MAATMERLEEYRSYNTQFCKRLLDFLSIMCMAQVRPPSSNACRSVHHFPPQSKLLLGDTNGITKPGRGRPTIKNHKPLETYLGQYGGLMLYLKEMDETVYGKLCAVHIYSASLARWC